MNYKRKRDEIERPEPKVDHYMEQLQIGPMSYSRGIMEKLGIIQHDERIEASEKVMQETGGTFKGGILEPRDQFRKDRSIDHIEAMDSIHTISAQGVSELQEEENRIRNEMDLYPERRKVLAAKLLEIQHYRELGLQNGTRISGAALQDGKFAFQKEVESSARENIRNVRTYEEETHVQSITVQQLDRKIRRFQEDSLNE